MDEACSVQSSRGQRRSPCRESPMAEPALVEVEVNDRHASGLLHRTRPVPLEAVDGRIGVKIGKPIHVRSHQWAEEQARGLQVNAAFASPGFSNVQGSNLTAGISANGFLGDRG